MIQTKDLSKKFGSFLAVNSISFKVEPGHILALLGPNGAGKTTTIRLLTSLLVPSSGTAEICGFDVRNQPVEVRSVVGVLTEHHGLYTRMPVKEYLGFFGRIYGMDSALIEKRSKELLSKFGLGSVANKQIGELSKGMRQKLALTRALIHDPRVLLLDEPTSAMDPESARLVRDSIHSLRSGDRTILICTHNLAEAEELADQIAIIQQGKIILNGMPETLKKNFLGPSEYEIIFSKDLNGIQPDLPVQAVQIKMGSHFIRFKSGDPETVNPQVLMNLLNQGLPVMGLKEIPYSLEQVYLYAVEAGLKERID